MFIIKYRKIFFTISAILVLGAIASIAYFGLNIGIDFKGGSILEVEYVNGRPDMETVDALVARVAQNAEVVPTGENGVIIRSEGTSEEYKTKLEEVLSDNGAYTIKEKRFNAIGPTIGAELRKKAWVAIATVVLAIILFIAYVFRHVSEPVSSARRRGGKHTQ